MTLRVAIVLVLLSILASGTRAQQGNCCQIQVSGLTETGRQPKTVPPSSAGPGGSYYPSITDTYGIACIKSQTAQPCNSAAMPNNSVTATGAGANVNGKFVQCEQLFFPITTQALPNSVKNASFVDSAIAYTGVNSSGGCILMNPQPITTSTCIFILCPSSGGGGGCFVGCDCIGGCITPIIFDLNNHGYALSDAQHGVMFDFFATGNPVRMSWTEPGADNGFLALPGADGLVHNGTQLFGNMTPQPRTNDPNGFRALAVYDDPKNGGNGDGVIDARDAVFALLRIWIDVNHDGVSQPEELHTLPSLGITSINLKYTEQRRTDQFGDIFRYRGSDDSHSPEPSHVDRVLYDVILLNGSTGAAKANPPTACPILPAVKAAKAEGNPLLAPTNTFSEKSSRLE